MTDQRPVLLGTLLVTGTIAALQGIAPGLGPLFNGIFTGHGEATARDLDAKTETAQAISRASAITLTRARHIYSGKVAKAAPPASRTAAVQGAWDKAQEDLSDRKAALQAKIDGAYGPDSKLHAPVTAFGDGLSGMLILAGWPSQPGEAKRTRDIANRRAICKRLVEYLNLRKPSAWCEVLARHDNADDTYRQRFETLARHLTQRQRDLIRKIDKTPTRYKSWP